jgi:hypothetical protein
MKDDFNNASWSYFWLIFWALCILDDADRRDKDRRKKQDRQKRIDADLQAKARRAARPSSRP